LKAGVFTDIRTSADTDGYGYAPSVQIGDPAPFEKRIRFFLEKKGSILEKEIVRRKKGSSWDRKKGSRRKTFGEQINHPNTPHSSKH
jgi:hypothetical protein